MVYLVLVSIALLGLGCVGVYCIVQYTRTQLPKQHKMWELHKERTALDNWIRHKKLLRDGMRSEEDPNWMRLDATIKIKQKELDEVRAEILDREIEQAERDALE